MSKKKRRSLSDDLRGASRLIIDATTGTTQIAAWPVDVDELVLIGHSMGGLVARGACVVAESDQLHWRG